ncbi:MAG TPA: helix-turn-helix transcriptional regulator [Chloroflexota bacterium]
MKLTNLRRIRLRRAWSQARLAERSGVGKSTILRIENGQAEPHPSTHPQTRHRSRRRARSADDHRPAPPGRHAPTRQPRHSATRFCMS